MMTVSVVLFIIEIICFIAVLFYTQRRFERKFFTPRIKHELEELVTAFNRQAETNILMIEDRLNQGRTLLATLENERQSLQSSIQSSIALAKTEPKIEPKAEPFSHVALSDNYPTHPLKPSKITKTTSTQTSKSSHPAKTTPIPHHPAKIVPTKKTKAQQAKPKGSQIKDVKKQTSKKKEVTLNNPKGQEAIIIQSSVLASEPLAARPREREPIQAIHLPQSPNNPAEKRLTPTLSPLTNNQGLHNNPLNSPNRQPLTKPATKQQTAERQTKNHPLKQQNELTLDQRILKLAEEHHSLAAIAQKLDIPLNEVRLRLELQRSQINQLKDNLQKRLSH